MKRDLIDHIAALLYWPTIINALAVLILPFITAWTTLINLHWIEIWAWIIAAIDAPLFLLMTFSSRMRAVVNDFNEILSDNKHEFGCSGRLLLPFGDRFLSLAFFALSVEWLVLLFSGINAGTFLHFATALLTGLLMIHSLKIDQRWRDRDAW